MTKNVYIATLPHSGSTPLGISLGQHSLIHHGGESAYTLADPKEITCPCGAEGCAFLTAVYHQALQDERIGQIFDACIRLELIQEPRKFYHLYASGIKNPAEAPITMIPDRAELEIYLAEALPNVAAGLEKLAEIYRALTGRPIVVDNSKYIRLAEHLATRESWRIIVLVRDPRALAYANKQAEVRKRVPRPLALKMQVYVDFAKRAYALIQYPNALCVRYEDLCRNPAHSLKRICRFLEIRFEADMLNLRSAVGHTVNGNRMRFDPANARLHADHAWECDPGRHDIATQLRASDELTSAYRALGYCLE